MTRHRFLVAIVLLGLTGVACGSDTPTPQPSPTPAVSPGPSGSGLRPDPNAAAYALRDPWAPARPPGTRHEIDLAIFERFMTVAQGFVQEVWTIDGTVPGPVIRTRVGDSVEVHLVNQPPEGSYPQAHPARNDHPHSVEFHGSTGASEEQLTPIMPLRDTTFEFTTEDAGVWMYNGSTEPVLESVVNGMYGMMIVEPSDGFERADHEFFLVQGEWYIRRVYPPLPPLPSLEEAQAPDPAPDFVVLNGVADQYVDHPIEVETGERIRAFVLNAGPNLDMSFRIEGVDFERVIRDGTDLPVGGAVDLAPGQGAIVEFTLAEDGMYPIFTDPLANGRGAAGLIRAAAGEA